MFRFNLLDSGSPLDLGAVLGWNEAERERREAAMSRLEDGVAALAERQGLRVSELDDMRARVASLERILL